MEDDVGRMSVCELPLAEVDMDRVCFTVNGVECSVGSEVCSEIMLIDYLREFLELRGTKYMCREGGCGACIVVATKPDGRCFAVNSCLISVTSCKDWKITTIEGLGDRSIGYHKLQKTLADNDGTQCGYCSPGWVMAMHGLLKTKKDLTMLEIEQSFGSNVCRCTGYRPILKAFKMFGVDASESDKVTPDIEDLKVCDKGNCKNCTCNNPEDNDWLLVSKDGFNDTRILKINLKDNKVWYKVYTLRDIFEVLQNEGLDSYMLVSGNTAKGAYPIDEYPKIMIDITSVEELKKNSIDQNLVLGAGCTLTETLNILQDRSNEDGFSYLTKLCDHILKVAHIPVRNVGSIAGNLMTKHAHNDFPSDIFLLLETVGAQLTISTFYHKTRLSRCLAHLRLGRNLIRRKLDLAESCIDRNVNYKFKEQTVTMQEFLQLDMKGEVIINVLLMPLSDEYHLFTYKLMPRSQSAHAIVNAGFLYQIKEEKVKSCRITYGGLSPKFCRAFKTEAYLVGNCLFTNEILQGALKTLDKELIVEVNLKQMSVEYRKQVAKALFYKGLLSLCPPSKRVTSYASGAIGLHDTRPLSHGVQKYDTNKKSWPLNQPIGKIEGLFQCAGETKYADDIPAYPGEVFAAFVLSTVGLGEIVNINAKQALNEPGVIAFYTAKDIPGLNSFTPSDQIFLSSNEEILAESTIKYFNQPIGIIVAKTQHIANKASKLVKATYTNVRKPVVDIAVAKKDSTRVTPNTVINAIIKGIDIRKVISGSKTVYGQYHFTMETYTCVAKPTQEGISLYSSTQWMNGVQIMISRALKIDANKIDVHVRNIGGGFGGKVARSIQSAVACSLVVQKLNRPCRLIQPLTTNFRVVGKRAPCSVDYEVGVNNKGVIQYNNYNMYEDNGHIQNELLLIIFDAQYFHCYDLSKWNYKSFYATTDTAKTTILRAPGTLEAVAISENLMERIAYELALDPIDVRLANLAIQDQIPIKEMLQKLSTDADYKNRRTLVNKFNEQNRWKKRGLRFSVAKFVHPGFIQNFDVNLSVFHVDGSIVITHGGIEMGQGLNTKIVQTCAYMLDVPIEKIQIKESNTIFAPNGTETAASITSQSVTIALRRCCKELLLRLSPTRTRLINPTWEELIAEAYKSQVDLQCHGFVDLSDIQIYNVYGVVLCETEVDILTGEYEVLRVDILQDVGQSVSPRIDVGQVEGAFVMALGYWTCEKLIYNQDTGEIVTDRTWDYHVPQARDIPQDFRVTFQKNTFLNPIILNAKAIAEPPSTLAVVVTFALREAIAAARQQADKHTKPWFDIDGPWTTEQVCMAAQTDCDSFKFC